MIISFKHISADETLTGRLVVFSQRINQDPEPEYKHCEILFPQWHEAFAARPESGVKALPIAQVIREKSKWDSYEIPGNDLPAREWLVDRLDARYDFSQIIGLHGLGLSFSPKKNAYSCSELAYIVIRDFTQLPINRTLNPEKVTPAQLRYMVQQSNPKKV